MFHRCLKFITTIHMVTTMMILLSQAPIYSALNETTTVAGNETVTQERLTAVYGTTTQAATSVIPQIVLTLGLIGGCALLGLSIAKLGDYCYDRRMAMRDDISNASEYTKNILRQRLAVMKMKQDPETEDGKTVKKAASAWIETTVTHKKKGDGQEEGEGGDKSGTVGQSAAAGAEGKTEGNEDLDVEKGIPVPQLPKVDVDTANIGNNKVSPEAEAIIKSETTDAAGRSPLPINKVAPVKKDLPRPQVLPPIGQRPRTANRPINNPIRSTR